MIVLVVGVITTLVGLGCSVPCIDTHYRAKRRRGAERIAAQLLDNDIDVVPEMAMDPVELLDPVHAEVPPQGNAGHQERGGALENQPTPVLLPAGKRRRKLYMAHVISAIKIKMGTPERTAANRMVVRRMATDMMSEHGLRPAHQKRVIDLIIAGVFVPDCFEVNAREWEANIGDRTSPWASFFARFTPAFLWARSEAEYDAMI